MGDLGGRVSSQSELKGLPFQVACVFRYSGSPVPVNNPRIRIYSQDSNNIIPFRTMDCLATSGDNTEYILNNLTGYAYSCVIDPLSLPVGVYKVVFSGELDDQQKTLLQIQGVIGIEELSRVDRILTTALAVMMDNPEEYLFKPQVHQFKAYNLYKYYVSGLQYINAQPTQSTSYSIEDLPENMEVYLVDYIVAKAMFGKARIGVENDFQINDSRSITQETYSKYKGLHDTLMQNLTKGIQDTKKMLRPSSNGHMRSRYPRLMQRLLSLSPYYTNVFTTQ